MFTPVDFELLSCKILPESCKIMHNLVRFLPESCKIIFHSARNLQDNRFSTKTCKITIFQQETYKITIFLPESCKLTIRSARILQDNTFCLPESYKITIFSSTSYSKKARVKSLRVLRGLGKIQNVAIFECTHIVGIDKRKQAEKSPEIYKYKTSAKKSFHLRSSFLFQFFSTFFLGVLFLELEMG